MNRLTRYAVIAALGIANLAAAQSKPVTLTIVRLSQIDNLDKDFIKADRADFYARMWIGGKLKQTPVFIADDGQPNWTYSRKVSGNRVEFRLKLLDDDGGLEDRDDVVDINPRDGIKELRFWLDRKTGRISGDVSGRRGEVIHLRGAKDGDKAEIWLSVK